MLKFIQRANNSSLFADNRFDHRPFLYRANWSWQFKAIDDELDRITRSASHKLDHSEGETKTRSDSHGKLNLEKQQSSPMTFGSADGLPALQHDEVVVANGLTGAISSGNISVFDKNAPNAALKKSQSTSYNKSQVNVLGKLKDRTGVPV